MRHLLLPVAFAFFLTVLGGCNGTGVSAYRTDELSHNDVEMILNHAEAAAKAQPSLLRVNAQGQPQTCRMHIMVLDRTGHTVGRRSMEDAWHGSISIALSKAYTAMAFSSNENALSTRSIGALSQPGGPLWNIGNSNRGALEPGLIEFPGGLPLYKNGRLVGGIGVSGDGVDQDESVAAAGASGFDPPEAIRIDTASKGALPYKK